jgi:hypothetical protein
MECAPERMKAMAAVRFAGMACKAPRFNDNVRAFPTVGEPDLKQKSLRDEFHLTLSASSGGCSR